MASPGSDLHQSIPVGAGESPCLIKCHAPTGMGWMCWSAAESDSSQEAGWGKSFSLYISSGVAQAHRDVYCSGFMFS